MYETGTCGSKTTLKIKKSRLAQRAKNRNLYEYKILKLVM